MSAPGWRAAGPALVRAPALAVEQLASLTGAEDPDAAALRLLADPEVALALEVASPSLGAAVRDRLAAGDPLGATREPVLAYLTRMSARATPFGMFAGVALAGWGAAALDLGTTQRRSRPDMAWLDDVAAAVEADPDVRPRLLVTTHPAAYEHAGRVVLPGGTSVRATPVVLQALAACRRPVDVAHLVAALGRDADRVSRLVDQLLDEGFLVGGLRPALRADPARHLAAQLHDVAPEHPRTALLGAVLDALDTWDTLPVAAAAGTWPDCAGDARPHPRVQVDTAFVGTRLRLPSAVADEAARAADLLCRLSPWPTRTPGLEPWTARFVATYGLRRPVPVPQLLEDGLPDLRLPGPQRGALDLLLVRLAGEAAQDGIREVELTDDLVARLEEACGPHGARPPSLDLCCALVARHARDLDAGRFRLVVTGNGATTPAGRTLGRFAHLLGAGASVALADVTDDGDRLTAELLFEPTQHRAADVMLRPLPSHAIVVDGGVPSGPTVIPLPELAVLADDDGPRLVWTRTGATASASYRHMLNPRLAPPLAQFLHAVSHAGEMSVPDRFFWGAAEHLPVLPRITSGRVVLRRATWNAAPATLAALAAAAPAGRRRLRRRAGLPRHVLVGGGDEQLLVDLESAIGARLLAAAVRRVPPSGRLVLQEALPRPADAPATSSRGRHLVELVVPLVADPRRAEPNPPRATVAVRPDQRVRLPGSDWLYARLYCSGHAADDLLAGPVRVLTERLCAAGTIASWFVVRYADPAPHLRLRLTGDRHALRDDALPTLLAWAEDLVAQGRLDRLALDTYEREVERYGGPGPTAVVERLFGADSVAVAGVLADRALARRDRRLYVTARTADDLLAGLGWAPERRVRWYRAARAVRSPAESAAFRAEKNELRRLLAPGVQAVDPGAPDLLERLLTRRRTEVERAATALAAAEAAGRLTVPSDEVVASVLHMHVNRMIGGGAPVDRRVFALAGLTLASLLAWPPEPGIWPVTRASNRSSVT